MPLGRGPFAGGERPGERSCAGLAACVRAAETRARNVIAAAEEESRRLKNETADFLDHRLGSFEILLDRLSKTVANGRQKLSIGSQPPAEAEEPIEQQGGAGFFDQDLS